MNIDKKIIIVEGVDGVGKTKLVNELAEKHKRKYGNDPIIVHEDSTTDYSNIVDVLKETDIFDRSLIGELIWSEVFERTPQLSSKRVKEIFNELKSQGYKIQIILKMTSVYNINQNIKSRNEKELTYNPIKVFSLYIYALQELGLDYKVVNLWK